MNRRIKKYQRCYRLPLNKKITLVLIFRLLMRYLCKGDDIDKIFKM